jgi:hypothetical protein
MKTFCKKPNEEKIHKYDTKRLKIEKTRLEYQATVNSLLNMNNDETDEVNWTELCIILKTSASKTLKPIKPQLTPTRSTALKENRKAKAALAKFPCKKSIQKRVFTSKKKNNCLQHSNYTMIKNACHFSIPRKNSIPKIVGAGPTNIFASIKIKPHNQQGHQCSYIISTQS